jgi:hypothetical protein
MWHALRTAPGPLTELYRLRYVRLASRPPLVFGHYAAPVFQQPSEY